MNADELQMRDDMWRVLDQLADALRAAGFVDVHVDPDDELVSFYDERSCHTVAFAGEWTT